MDIDEFIKIFRESFDELNEEISPSTKFKELEYWTSMQALLLIAHVDDTLGFVFSADNIRGSESIEDLYRIYQNA
tara:strand:- start:558 stop:782 length:225 start_codon:yes stop_codon:yes gene_type:complete